MRCPVCDGTEVEATQHVDVVSAQLEYPYVIYYCEECGSEWKWVKGDHGLRILFNSHE